MKKVFYYGNDESIYNSLKSIIKIKKNFEIEKQNSFTKKSLEKDILILDDSFVNFIKMLNLIPLNTGKNIIITTRKENINLHYFQNLRIFVKPIKILDLYQEISKKVKNYSSSLMFNLNISNHSIINTKGKELKLTEKEFRLVEVLLDKNGTPLSKKQILSSVWGLEQEKSAALDTRVLETLISRIRKKIRSFDIKASIKKKKDGYVLIS